MRHVSRSRAARHVPHAGHVILVRQVREVMSQSQQREEALVGSMLQERHEDGLLEVCVWGVGGEGMKAPFEKRTASSRWRWRGGEGGVQSEASRA